MQGKGGGRVAFDMLIGNEVLRARLERDVRSGTLSHAYLIEGASGSGRRTLATALCASLVCQRRGEGTSIPCGVCDACRRVYEGKSVDVIRLGREDGKASIGVDEIRFLRSDVLFAPNAASLKVYIIEEADLMTTAAQNALLLTLEEPPEYVLFLLLCESASAMLETIRSRAQLLRMTPIDDAQMDKHLSSQRAYTMLPEHERRQLVLLADGRVGRALELLNGAERKVLMERQSLAARCVTVLLGDRGKRDVGAVPELLSDIGIKRDTVTIKREALLLLLSDIQLALRDLVLLKRAEEVVLRFYTDREAAIEISERTTPASLLDLFDEIERVRSRITRNANIRLVMTDLLYLSH
jgi:DNA polymerase-3 subunit delta'